MQYIYTVPTNRMLRGVLSCPEKARVPWRAHLGKVQVPVKFGTSQVSPASPVTSLHNVGGICRVHVSESGVRMNGSGLLKETAV